MSHKRVEQFNDDRTGVKYCLVVFSEVENDWEIQVFDKNGTFKETLTPPRAFNFIPIAIRKTMKLDLKRFQDNILADKSQKQG